MITMEPVAKARPGSVARVPMPMQEPAERIHNFQEVPTGYTPALAQREASRCLECKDPLCVRGCPVGVDIRGFVTAIRDGDFARAIHIIRQDNALPAVCGRVCPQETQCEQLCVLGRKHEPVAIGRLERFAADWEREQLPAPTVRPEPRGGRRIAVVGSGPAGLTVAGDLARLGHSVTLFEALHKAGGVLMYGIPEFRLPKAIVQEEVDRICALGVKLVTNAVIGRMITVSELLEEEGFDGVFLGVGAGLPWFLDIPGENLNGVYSANEYLTRVNLMSAWDFPNSDTPVRPARRVAVFGGGNVAMDAARTAVRLGAEEVHIIYRRSREEMPARQEEIEHALEEGVRLQLLYSPLRIGDDGAGNVRSVLCQRMELGEPDSSGRRRPLPVPNSEFELETDAVIVAIGNGANPLLTGATPQLELNRKGNIVAESGSGRTSIPGVYAGGDIVLGAATVILAMGAGRRAAAAIHHDLQVRFPGKGTTGEFHH